jgi:hypothetical protein
MWNVLFAIGIAASVWFSAASLAIELPKQRATFLAAIDKSPRELLYRQTTSADNGDRQPSASQLD